MSIMNLEQLKEYSLKVNNTEQEILVTKTSGEEISDFKNLERTYSIQGNNDLFFIIDGQMYINLPSDDVIEQLNYADFKQKDFIVSGLNFNELRQYEKIKLILCMEEYLLYIQAMVQIIGRRLLYYKSKEEENTFMTEYFSKVMPSDKNIQMYIEKVRIVKLKLELLLEKSKEWFNIINQECEMVEKNNILNKEFFCKCEKNLKEIENLGFKSSEKYKQGQGLYLRAKTLVVLEREVKKIFEMDLYKAKEISLYLEELLKNAEGLMELLENLKKIKVDYIKMYREKM